MKREISLIKFIFLFLDLILFWSALVLTLFLRFGPNFHLFFEEHFLPFLFLLPFYLIFLFAFNLYDFYLVNLRSLFFKFFNFILIALIFSIVYFYLGSIFFEISPKTNLFIFLLSLSFLLFLSRFIFYRFFQKPQKVYFLGEVELKEKLKRDLLNYQLFIFQEDQFQQKYADNTILIVSPHYKFKNSQEINKLLSLNIPIFDFVDFYEKFLGRIPLEAVDFDWFLRKISFGKSNLYFYLKRIIDIFVSLLIFIFLFLPLFLPIAILIFISDPGPIFFKQERVGYKGRIFKIIKFRTMKEDKETSGKWAIGEEEKRIFFIGKILRKTHLDELPQVINILKGDLSLVGPRPEQPKIYEELKKTTPFYFLRELIHPGLTGWAQVNYKYPENIEETKIKLEYDLYYLKNANLFLDILIVIKTFQKLFF
jgi:lipopolysaccharide/colanic/teichoic acid biosynthesis glycosyltransferase